MFTTVDGIPVRGKHDEATLARITRRADDPRVAGAALLADGHKGHSMPIGGVVAYRNAVLPSGVGRDISRGLKGVMTDLREGEVRPGIGRIMDEVARTVVFGIGRASGQAVDHPLFDHPARRRLDSLPLNNRTGSLTDHVGSTRWPRGSIRGRCSEASLPALLPRPVPEAGGHAQD